MAYSFGGTPVGDLTQGNTSSVTASTASNANSNNKDEDDDKPGVVSTVIDTASNIASNVANAASDAATGFVNDAKMGYDKLTMSAEEFVKKYGQDEVDDFEARTAVTAKINTALQTGNTTGLSADELVRYNQMKSMQDSGGGSSGETDDQGSALDNAVDDFLSGSNTGPLSPESILEMATTSGLVTSNDDLSDLAADPKAYLEARGASLSDLVPSLDAETAGALLDPNNPNYILKGDLSFNPSLVSNVSKVTAPDGKAPVSYDVATNSDRLDNPQYKVDPVTGEIRDENLVDADDIQIDMTGAATGVNADGTVNETGQALNDYAIQKFSNIIDTSTVAGKLLADELGEGNYTDSKSTILGQMDIISKQFVDGNGNPKIPPWAQGVSRNVSRTIAFKGMSGTAATAAMATAMMEASLGVAEKEATFFQTLTIKNLDNRQEAIINKANVLAKFDLANLDARETAAVTNAQAFLKMDLTNLTNEQQAEIINTQAKVDALFADTNATNAERLFAAESQNEFTKFYDQMGVQVATFNAEQANLIAKFNAGEINDAAEFSAAMEDSRQKFYAEMQYQVDTANAKWRQTVATVDTQMKFEAAAADVKGILDINQEILNRTWDRADAMLDYIFKGSVAQEEFELKLLLGQMQAQAGSGGGSNPLGDIAKMFTTKWLLGI